MKDGVVIDTNVPVVANGKHPRASLDCVLACSRALSETVNTRRVLIDDRGLIFDEYQRNLSFAGQPGVGNAFFKWLWDRQGNCEYCRKVSITPNATGSFSEFPSDPALASFDSDDRKFVATSVASGEQPPILNASDTDWWQHRKALKGHGVQVQFLCPELMRAKS